MWKRNSCRPIKNSDNTVIWILYFDLYLFLYDHHNLHHIFTHTMTSVSWLSRCILVFARQQVAATLPYKDYMQEVACLYCLYADLGDPPSVVAHTQPQGTCDSFEFRTWNLFRKSILCWTCLSLNSRLIIWYAWMTCIDEACSKQLSIIATMKFLLGRSSIMCISS